MNADIFVNTHPEIAVVSVEIEKQFINGSSKKQSMHQMQFEQMNIQIVDEQTIIENYKQKPSELIIQAEELKANKLLDDAIIVVGQLKNFKTEQMQMYENLSSTFQNIWEEIIENHPQQIFTAI